MKPLATFIGILIYLIALSSPALGNPLPISEPPLESRIDWDVAVNGLLFVSYDLDHNNRPDYFTLRPVITSYFSPDSVSITSRNHPSCMIFSVNYQTKRFYYIASMKPLFFAFDVNEDGRWDIIYKDVSQDGVNGNEEFYASPSGMFGRK